MNKQLRIIGLAGTNGSGKDTVGQLLSQYHNYLFVSVTDLLRAELKIQGLSIVRSNLRNLGDEWRRENGLGALVDKAMDIYERNSDKYVGVAIASLRNSGEVDRVHELGGTVVWVDADPQVRYRRVQINAESRGRAGEDLKTYKQFLAEENSEMNRSPGSEKTALNMSEVKEQSDIYINNDARNIESLRRKIEKSLNL